MINEGQVEWTRGFGVMESGSDSPVSANTLFQAASISKILASGGDSGGWLRWNVRGLLFFLKAKAVKYTACIRFPMIPS